MNLQVYVPLTWTPAGSWLLYLPSSPRWNPVFTGWGYSFFGAILHGRDGTNGVHFPLRLTFFCTPFRPETPKIRSHVLGEVVLAPVRLDLHDFRAKNQPVYAGYGWKSRVGMGFGLSRVLTHDRMNTRVLQTGAWVSRRRRDGLDNRSFTLPVLLS
jgi:hypothetical protein